MNLKTTQLITIILLLFGAIVFSIFFFSRSTFNSEDVASSNPFLSNSYNTEVEEYLAGLSFYEKAAQNIIVKIDHGQNGNESVLEIIEQHNPGFIILSNAKNSLLKQLRDSLPSSNHTLLGVELNALGNLMIDSILLNEPYKLLGTLNNDSLVYDVAYRNGALLKSLGISFVYGLPSTSCKTSTEQCFTASIADSNGNKPQLFMSGFQDAGLLALTNPISDIKNNQLLKSLITNNVSGISFNSTLNDSLKKEYATFLKDSLSHTGYLIATQNERNVEAHLLAGSNLMLVERNLASVINNLNKAGAKNKTLKKAITKNAFKTVLARVNIQKSLSNYKNNQLKFANDALFKQTLKEKALVIVKNADQQIPIRELTNKKIATLSVGDSKATQFKKEIDRYGPNPWFHISNISTETTINSTFKRLKLYNHIFVCIQNPNIENDSLPYTISSTVLNNLHELNKNANVIIVLFEESKLLKNFAAFESIIYVPYKNDDHIAAQLAFGAIPSNGKLNVNVDSNFMATKSPIATNATRLKFTQPIEAGIADSWLKKIDAIAYESIAKRATPGCQVFIALDGKIIHQKSYGYHTYKRKTKVKNTDLYDLASITKIGSTTLTAMHAYEAGKLNLNEPLSSYLPEKLKRSSLGKVTVKGALTHNSGLPAWVPAYRYIQCVNDNFGLYDRFYCYQPSEQFNVEVRDSLYLRNDFLDSVWAQIRVSMSLNKPKYKYSDLGPFLVKQALDNILDDTIHNIVQNKFANPLGLQSYIFNPLQKFELTDIVPTEKNSFQPKKLVHGHVHDPISAVFGGIAGHAGLFSNATDLGVIMQMLLNKGSYGGKQFFRPSTIKQFANTQPNSHRGIGFNKSSATGYSAITSGASAQAYGHTGFTGTCAWVDPQHNLVFVFLSNRVHPTSANKKLWKLGIRKRMHQVMYDAIAERDKVNIDKSNIKPVIDSFKIEDDSLISNTFLPYNRANISY